MQLLYRALSLCFSPYIGSEYAANNIVGSSGQGYHEDYIHAEHMYDISSVSFFLVSFCFLCIWVSALLQSYVVTYMQKAAERSLACADEAQEDKVCDWRHRRCGRRNRHPVGCR